MIYYVFAFLVFLLDQASKWIIVKKLALYESRSVIGEFFQITSQRNKGAAFGILQNQRWFFIVITIAVVIGIVWYMRKVVKQNRKLLPLALSLILGGALGNFVDRALFGEVVDFLQFHFQFSLFGRQIDYVYPIFNFADSAIVIGVGLILLDSVREWRQEKRGLRNDVSGA